MTLFWKIRYLDRTDRTFKDRSLFLDSEVLSLAERTALELVLEMDSPRSRRDILKFRHLFREEQPADLKRADGSSRYRSFFLPDYFEDETGAEINQYDFWEYLKPDDAPKPELPIPIPVAEVTLTDNEIRLLGYFIRDHRELSESALMKEGPAHLSASRRSTQRDRIPQKFLQDIAVRRRDPVRRHHLSAALHGHGTGESSESRRIIRA